MSRDWVLYFDPEGRLARMDYSSEGPQGPAKMTEAWSDWKAVGPVQYPHSTKMLLDGNPMMEATVTQTRVNPDLPESLFKKPAP
jgi:hypothetical protein